MTAAEVRVAAARVREKAGLFVLDEAPFERALVEVRGDDRVRWLNGMISNVVEPLAAEGDAGTVPALLLTPKGKVVALFRVVARADALWLECAREAAAPAVAQLDRFIVADDVELADVSAAWARFALEGPRAPEFLAALGAQPVAADARGAMREFALDGHRVVAAAGGWSGEAGFLLFVETAGADALRAAVDGAAGESVACGAAVLDALRVEAGHPIHGREIDDVLPAEAGLEFAIALDKGCYTGQEIVARVHARGSVHRTVAGVVFDAPDAQPGPLFTDDGREVGRVTSCADADGRTLGLALLRREAAEPGTALVCDGRPTRVTALPHVPAPFAAKPG